MTAIGRFTPVSGSRRSNTFGMLTSLSVEAMVPTFDIIEDHPTALRSMSGPMTVRFEGIAPATPTILEILKRAFNERSGLIEAFVPEWMCLYCGSPNPLPLTHCKKCGGPRSWLIS